MELIGVIISAWARNSQLSQHHNFSKDAKATCSGERECLKHLGGGTVKDSLHLTTSFPSQVNTSPVLAIISCHILHRLLRVSALSCDWTNQGFAHMLYVLFFCCASLCAVCVCVSANHFCRWDCAISARPDWLPRPYPWLAVAMTANNKWGQDSSRHFSSSSSTSNQPRVLFKKFSVCLSIGAARVDGHFCYAVFSCFG